MAGSGAIAQEYRLDDLDRTRTAYIHGHGYSQAGLIVDPNDGGRPVNTGVRWINIVYGAPDRWPGSAGSWQWVLIRADCQLLWLLLLLGLFLRLLFGALPFAVMRIGMEIVKQPVGLLLYRWRR